MFGVSDRAGLVYALRYRRNDVAFPLASRRQRSDGVILSRLNTRPTPSSVNAPTAPLRVASHVSGPVCFAKPSLPHDSFSHYTSPVERAHKETIHEAKH